MKKFLFAILITSILIACNNEKKEDKPSADAAADTLAPENKNADELLAMSEGDGIKNSFLAFSKADIEGMTADYDDNILYTWSNGDSLRGKKAVQDYYQGRWKLLDSISFSEQIVLPIKVNVSQSPFAPAGKWVLFWTMAHVKYKNGKKLDFWMHNVNHYNDAGKIDLVGQYLDRHPILEATKDLMK